MVIGLFIAPARAATSEEHTYLAQLVAQARHDTLAQDRYWHILLHYRPTLFGGVTSEQDDPDFFLAPQGKTDPQTELEATLVAFFSDQLVGRSKQPAQCAFVARYQWLREQLQFDDTRLPRQRCERFDRWVEEFNTDGVSLIFPTAYMNNPASMFGHTFLRLDQRGQTEQTRLLAYTINYAAEVPPDAGLEYAYKGLFGGYQGFFSTIPYYLKVREYRDIENRDIWEYRLNFSEPQIRRLLLHAWELGNASFDYYFLKENCSYHLLSLLEAARPELRLTDRFTFWTVPADTLRALIEQPGLVGHVAYRPSRSTVITHKRATLSTEEHQWLHRLIDDQGLARTADFGQLPPPRQALLLDVASDYLLYKSETDREQAASFKAGNQQILMARSALRIPSPPFSVRPRGGSPEQGHEKSRAGIGIGWRQNEWFEEVNVRLAYHDLLDPEAGYTPNAQIELLGLAVRHYARRDQVRLERFTFANVLSLSPVDRLSFSPSWKVSAGLQTVRQERAGVSCRYCANGNFNGGPGLAVQTDFLRREVWFGFAEVDVNVSPAYVYDHRAGGGGTLGLYADLSERWRMLASTTYLHYPLGEQSDDWRASVQQRVTIQNNLAIRGEFNHRRHDNEALLTLHAYF
ncbi:MAG: DUF4105 domain-containing protein [Nitrospira sp.]|nr:MAG: DUF4105 domain-containing protein [Nitrospira sp.]